MNVVDGFFTGISMAGKYMGHRGLCIYIYIYIHMYIYIYLYVLVAYIYIIESRGYMIKQ